eukprot:2525156-Prymnesium_polylepis.1
MEGATELDAVRADTLYETAKDLGTHKSAILSGEGDRSAPKGPWALAKRLEVRHHHRARPAAARETQRGAFMPGSRPPPPLHARASAARRAGDGPRVALGRVGIGRAHLRPDGAAQAAARAGRAQAGSGGGALRRARRLPRRRRREATHRRLPRVADAPAAHARRGGPRGRLRLPHRPAQTRRPAREEVKARARSTMP